MTIQHQLQSAIAHQNAGQFPQAQAICQQILNTDPTHFEALVILASLAIRTNHLDEAIPLLRRAAQSRPDHADVHYNLAIALQRTGRHLESIEPFRNAIRLHTNFPNSQFNLGIALNDLGTALARTEQIDQAITAFTQSTQLLPDFAEAHSNLGSAFKHVGQLDQAIAAYQHAINLNPNFTDAYHNLLLTYLYHPACTPKMIQQQLHRWDQTQNQPLSKSIHPHTNNPDPNRRLRIGYVSADFKEHVVGRNLLPLFTHHDHNQFEIFCYSNGTVADAVTQQFRQLTDHWRDIAPLSDSQAAQLIRQDQIDILVDLSLHTAGNRLGVFARKPAPIQITYLGYCGSTGMRAMDYRLSDPYFDPPGTDLSLYAEKTVRLTKTFWCYQSRLSPPVAEPPAIRNGFITFSCLNNFTKVSQPAIDCWATILSALTNSHLILHSRPGEHLNTLIQTMKRAGIAADRLRLLGKQSYSDYLQTYSQIDIALDPFPFAGGITTCDALWMGTPVVTLSGITSVGRGGRSILSNLGLPELIASSPDQYTQIAITLAADPDKLQSLRQSLRPRMQASPLMNAPTFTKDVETTFRTLWQNWTNTH